MVMIVDCKKDINSSIKEIQENMGKQQKPLKRKYKIPLKIYRKSNQTFQRSLAWPGARVLAKERECRQGGEVASTTFPVSAASVGFTSISTAPSRLVSYNSG